MSDEREALMARADDLGIAYSKFWNNKKLRAAIDAATPDVPDPRQEDPPHPALSTTLAEPDNRMMRYRRNPYCPNCDAHPVVCRMRRPGYVKFRCRVCGHRWEIDVRENPDRYVPGHAGKQLFKRFSPGGR